MPNRNPERAEDARSFAVYRGKEDFRTVDERYRQQGLFATLKFIYARVASRLGWWSYYLYHRSFDRRFDRQYGVDTCGIMFNDDLTVVGNNRASGLEYEPTPVRSFNKMLGEVKEDFSDFTFIDFGCGKGRTLLLASHSNFNKIRGVEFVKEIQEIAARNIAIYRPENQQCRDIEAVLCDAAEFEIPDDNCVFYFYFPFREDVLRVVMNNIVSSYRNSPRKMYFVVRLDKPEWTEITQRVFSEHAELQPFGRQPDLTGVRVMPFDVIYYKIPAA